MEFVVREITMTTVKGSKPEKEWTNHHNDIVKHHYISIILVSSYIKCVQYTDNYSVHHPFIKTLLCTKNGIQKSKLHLQNTI